MNWENRIVGYGVEDPEDLLPNEKNFRIHGKPQQDHMLAALQDVGWVQDVIINVRQSDEWPAGQRGIKTLCDGHLRVKLALRHEVHQVPVKYVDLTPRQEAVVLASFDAITGEASIDSEMLAMLLEDAQSDNPDMQQFLAKMAEEAGIVPPDGGVEDVPPQLDKAEELRKKWGVETGQLWQLGEHRLLCGDSTKREDVERVLDGGKPSCVFTDPPYGVAIGDKNKFLNTFQRAGRCLENIAGDCMGKDELFGMLVKVFTLVRETADPCCAVYVCAPQGGELGMMMMMMMMASGMPTRHVLNWIKNQPTFSMGRLDYEYQHEPILYTWVKTHKHSGLGPFKTSCWPVDKPRASEHHPTMKPVELYENAYLNSTDAGDVVYEPFCGSGTGILAAENTRRICRAVEIDPKYVAVAIQRWADATGKEPKLLK